MTRPNRQFDLCCVVAALLLAGCVQHSSRGTAASPQAPMTLSLHGVTFQFVRIPPGEFLMGSDAQEGTRPVHRVRIDTPFDLSTTEVTVAQYRAFTNATGFVADNEKHAGWKNWRRPGFAQADDHPAIFISRDDAGAFCEWLSRQAGVLYRLPTEAEWEYAARAGATGDGPADVNTVAWYRENSGGATHPVASWPPNAFGVYDMLGSAWEWVQDPWHKNYVGAPTDGRPWSGGDERVAKNFGWAAGDGCSLRGGTWYLEPELVTFVSRSAWPRNTACSGSGFRLLRPLPAAAPSAEPSAAR
jgi:formylglycine-generating enzyme required for sulfatase activity